LTSVSHATDETDITISRNTHPKIETRNDTRRHIDIVFAWAMLEVLDQQTIWMSDSVAEPRVRASYAITTKVRAKTRGRVNVDESLSRL
jgi:hypothetical protein